MEQTRWSLEKGISIEQSNALAGSKLDVGDFNILRSYVEAGIFIEQINELNQGFLTTLELIAKGNEMLELNKTNKEMMDALCEEKINIAEVFYHAIQFELTLPGRLLTSNAKVLKDNVVIWKIDGFRLLAGDYILTAESRVINYWAFGITLFMMLFVLGIFIKLYRRRS